MKKVILFGLSLFSAFTISAQCLEAVTGFGNNTSVPMYNIEGTVEVTLNPDGSVTLDLGDDFMTAAGPDIRAYLVNSGGLSDAQLTTTPIASLQNVQFGLVGSSTVPQNGAKSFTIDLPAGNDIQDFDKVFFYCLQFDQFWDFGTYVPFTDATCSILSTVDQDLNAFQMFPNPARENVEIVAEGFSTVTANILALNGTVVMEGVNIQENRSLDVSTLTQGIYLVQLTTPEGSSSIQKLVIQ
ncbi:DM13 domain-containing protein [Aureisphaera galaxeae]|uniref:DM13 domain-containing protein n=1 Tax=Aureisphaera galaxeae TaxID=1538023 RepID=UPI002350E974|nr:DM13 domain-containing protein [Aureisphaera galaxeae]MDC8005808.1 DM13 domain-containing protein [Aureisphaera galaxeae]